MLLKRGSFGPDVELLQIKLKAAGYNPGDVDGDFGAKTAAAVLAFQKDRPEIEDDGVFGPHTAGALDAAIAVRTQLPPVDVVDDNAAPIPCELTTWNAWLAFVDKITKYPVKYGPGRGLFVNGKFVVTHGPGGLGLKSWANFLGKSFPSFHCTSFTNFSLAWLLRRNELYTHGGNMPSLWDVLESSSDLHPYKGMQRVYRGYGESVHPIAPDGSTLTRTTFDERFKDDKIVDVRELYARRASLPTFIFCAQSTRRKDGTWMTWHHTVLYFIDHHDGHRMRRIAADGYRDPVRGYSAQPMACVEITEANVAKYDGVVYRAYGITPNADGTYGDQKKPIAEIAFEA